MSERIHKARSDNDLEVSRASRKRKPADELKEHRTIRIKARVAREIERQAAADERSFSDYSARVLERHVDSLNPAAA